MLSRDSEIVHRLNDYLNAVEEMTETMGGSAIENTSCSSHKNSFVSPFPARHFEHN